MISRGGYSSGMPGATSSSAAGFAQAAELEAEGCPELLTQRLILRQSSLNLFVMGFRPFAADSVFFLRTTFNRPGVPTVEPKWAPG